MKYWSVWFLIAFMISMLIKVLQEWKAAKDEADFEEFEKIKNLLSQKGITKDFVIYLAPGQMRLKKYFIAEGYKVKKFNK